jgi:undecaprenyl-diphosphatase
VLVRERQEVQALPRRLTRLVLLLSVAVAGVVLLAIGYTREPLGSADVDVAEWVAASLPSAFEWLARPFSWLGGWIGITAIGIAFGFLLVRERAWIDLGFLLATFVGSQIVVALLKDWFDRPRPQVGSVVDLPSSSGFPSGHAAAGVASLGAAAVLLAERLPSRRGRVWLWSFVAVAGVAVGLSRIALNVHYVTDVLAGWCWGLAWLAACLLAREAVSRRGVSSST